MQVRLVLHWWIGMNDEHHIIDVNATGSDVSRDQRHGSSIGERREVTHSNGLGQVAVHLDGRNSGGNELLGEFLRSVLCAREDHASTGRRGELDQDRESIVGLNVQHVVAHFSDG